MGCMGERGNEMRGTVCVQTGEWREGQGLMSPLTVQRDDWLICLQEVQMERGSLMVPNGQEGEAGG